MTTTSIITSQSIGTGSNIGPFIAPVKTTLNANTTAALISVSLTLGDTSASVSSKLRVWCAVSPVSYSTATVGAYALKSGAQWVELNLDPKGLPTLVLERASMVDITAAGYHYCWIEAPTLPVAATVTVNLLELP